MFIKGKECLPTGIISEIFARFASIIKILTNMFMCITTLFTIIIKFIIKFMLTCMITTRGGGLLKYCNLLVKNYRPAWPEAVKTMERYMCSR